MISFILFICFWYPRKLAGYSMLSRQSLPCSRRFWLPASLYRLHPCSRSILWKAPDRKMIFMIRSR